MSHSKGTTNYNLPLFTKDDRPAWLTDFNSAMQEVDAVMKRTSDAARPDLLEEAQADANEALALAQEAESLAQGALQKSGGAMSGALDMSEHKITNVQEMELQSSGAGLYIGSVVQPDGTTGARLTGVANKNAAAFVKPDTVATYVPVAVGAPVNGDDAVNKNSLNGTLSGYMKKSGATMTGALMLSGAPTEELQAATKKYVDEAVANVPTPTGGITQEQADARYVQLAGGTMTGDLKVLESPQSDTSAVSKSYAQGLFANALNTANTAKQTAEAALPKAGGTMTGALTLAGDPTGNLQAATKQYVDNAGSKRVLLGTYTGGAGSVAIDFSTVVGEITRLTIEAIGTPTSSGTLSISGVEWFSLFTTPNNKIVVSRPVLAKSNDGYGRIIIYVGPTGPSNYVVQDFYANAPIDVGVSDTNGVAVNFYAELN